MLFSVGFSVRLPLQTLVVVLLVVFAGLSFLLGLVFISIKFDHLCSVTHVLAPLRLLLRVLGVVQLVVLCFFIFLHLLVCLFLGSLNFFLADGVGPGPTFNGSCFCLLQCVIFVLLLESTAQVLLVGFDELVALKALELEPLAGLPIVALSDGVNLLLLFHSLCLLSKCIGHLLALLLLFRPVGSELILSLGVVLGRRDGLHLGLALLLGR